MDFPERIYVERNQDPDTDYPWLQAQFTAEEHLTCAGSKRIAVYRLESVKIVEAKLDVTVKET